MSAETDSFAALDEVCNEREPVGGAIEDVCVGEGDKNPTGELGEHGLGDVPGDATACGVPPGPPDAAVDLDGHLRIRPGKVSAEAMSTRPQPFLLLVRGPGVPHGQDELSLERQAGARDQPLVGKGFFQMAWHWWLRCNRSR